MEKKVNYSWLSEYMFFEIIEMGSSLDIRYKGISYETIPKETPEKSIKKTISELEHSIKIEYGGSATPFLGDDSY